MESDIGRIAPTDDKLEYSDREMYCMSANHKNIVPARNITARGCLQNDRASGFPAPADDESPLPQLKKLRKLKGKTKPIQRLGLHVELLD